MGGNVAIMRTDLDPDILGTRESQGKGQSFHRMWHTGTGGWRYTEAAVKRHRVSP